MLRLQAAVAILAITLLPAALAQNAPAAAAKLRVAVADFEVRGGNADLGKNLADAFAGPLFQTRRFELFDRRQTVALLNEIRFTQSGLAEQAQQLQARNIDVLVAGTINVNSPDSLRVDVMFTNVRTAQVQFADSLQGRGAHDFPDIAGRIVSALAQEFPLQAVILGQDGRNASRYYISIGSGSNIVVGVTGKFFQFQSIGGGRQIPLEAGTFKVVELSLDPTVSVIEVVSLVAGYKPRDGDAVTISLTGEAGPATASSPGRVTVRSNAPGTTISVGGQTRGTISAANGTIEVANLPPGQHAVTATAPGFAPATQTVTVPSGAAAQLEFRLAPAAGSGGGASTSAATTPQSSGAGRLGGGDLECARVSCNGVEIGLDTVSFAVPDAATSTIAWSKTPVVDTTNPAGVRIDFEVLFAENHGLAVQVVLAATPAPLCPQGGTTGGLNLFVEGLTLAYGAAIRTRDCARPVAISDQDLGVVGWRKASVRITRDEVCLYGPGDTKNVCYKPAAGDLPTRAFLGIGAAWTLPDPPNGGRGRLQVRNVTVQAMR